MESPRERRFIETLANDVRVLLVVTALGCGGASPDRSPSTLSQLRRWLPKGTDLNHHTQADLDTIAARINHMPRRQLNWRSAHDLYTPLVATVS